jgi:hypothetical protein
VNADFALQRWLDIRISGLGRLPVADPTVLVTPGVTRAVILNAAIAGRF